MKKAYMRSSAVVKKSKWCHQWMKWSLSVSVLLARTAATSEMVYLFRIMRLGYAF